MTEAELVAAIGNLDEAIPRDHAVVKFHQYGGGPDESQIIANRDGYLRLGVEFLKAGLTATGHKDQPNAVEVDLDYLTARDSSINFDWFERREMSRDTDVSSYEAGKLIPALVIGGCIAMIVFAIVGIVTVVGWFL